MSSRILRRYVRIKNSVQINIDISLMWELETIWLIRSKMCFFQAFNSGFHMTCFIKMLDLTLERKLWRTERILGLRMCVNLNYAGL